MIKEFLEFLGGGICHQIPERSLVLKSSYLPLCARCTGIYLGVFICFIYLVLRKRKNGNQPPSIPLLAILVLAFLPLIGDGLSSYLEFRETSNAIRLITGILFGSSLPFFIILIKNYDIKGNNDKPIIQNINEYSKIVAIALLVGFWVYSGYIPSWYLVSFILIFSIYMLYTQLFIGILKQIFPCFKVHRYMLTMAAYVMAFAWINLLSLFQRWVLRVIFYHHYNVL
ncbi:MAG: DUF2085 domain-containing protein [Epulopiscium sp.]|nr:DUF2085 domain-containing protein [Candidatus Epulonipiscium sp.]